MDSGPSALLLAGHLAGSDWPAAAALFSQHWQQYCSTCSPAPETTTAAADVTAAEADATEQEAAHAASGVYHTAEAAGRGHRLQAVATGGGGGDDTAITLAEPGGSGSRWPQWEWCERVTPVTKELQGYLRLVLVVPIAGGVALPQPQQQLPQQAVPNRAEEYGSKQHPAAATAAACSTQTQPEYMECLGAVAEDPESELVGDPEEEGVAVHSAPTSLQYSPAADVVEPGLPQSGDSSSREGADRSGADPAAQPLGGSKPAGKQQLTGVYVSPAATDKESCTVKGVPSGHAAGLPHARGHQPHGHHVLTVSVALHPSYQVPVVYLQAVQPDGTPLSLQQLLGDLPALQAEVHSYTAHQQQQQQDKDIVTAWELPGAISPADGSSVVGSEVPWVLDCQRHVVTGEVAWLLHPCETATRLQLLMEELLQLRSSDSQEAMEAGAHAQQCSPGNSPWWLLRYMLGWWSCVGHLMGLPCPMPPRSG